QGAGRPVRLLSGWHSHARQGLVGSDALTEPRRDRHGARRSSLSLRCACPDLARNRAGSARRECTGMSTIASSPSLTENPRCIDWIDLSRAGAVILKSGKVEIGQGITTALVQIAADELDVVPECVELISGHTPLGPVEAGTSSSLSIERGGGAVRRAASAVRAILLGEAATLRQAPPESLSVAHGRIVVNGRETDVTYWSLAPS